MSAVGLGGKRTCWLDLPPGKDVLGEIKGVGRRHRMCRNVTGEGLRNAIEEKTRGISSLVRASEHNISWQLILFFARYQGV
jgi:hypothetical protein